LVLLLLLMSPLKALVHAAEETEIVVDVRRELEQLLRMRRPSTVMRREISALRKEMRTRQEKVVGTLLRQAQVVLATCVGAANDKLLKGIEFDLVIIDEAAQALEAACWIPALRGKKLILAGDHCQLSPTIKSNNRRVQECLGITMFQRLMTLYGDDSDDVARKGGRVSRMLQVQYRMNELISDWASRAMYGGALCTHESVKHRTLSQLDGMVVPQDDEDYGTESPLLLIDTADCGMHESTNAAGSRYNEGEAQLVTRHVLRLLDMGVKQDQIAIITPYNGQVEILRAALLPGAPKLEIRSVDGFQGGEREAVVLSLVRSSERSGSSGIGFLRDDRRLNVVTRAPSPKAHLYKI
jgi:ATP-dependent RNA/DNA helicase IGHMBP2